MFNPPIVASNVPRKEPTAEGNEFGGKLAYRIYTIEPGRPVPF